MKTHGPGDHPWALTRNGRRPLTSDWDAGPHKITAETLESDVATGTAPLTVASTTVVSNLNADLLDGQEAAAFAAAADVADLQAKHRIFFQKSSATVALTATPTKVLTTSGTLTDHTSSGEWAAYDSGTGSADSIQYTGAAAKSGWLIQHFNFKHTSADGKPLNARAYPYINNTLQTASIPYGNTSTINGETVSATSVAFVTLAQNDYINPRAAYINTGNGASTNGQIAAFGYTMSFIEA